MRISDWSSDVCSSDLKPRIIAILTSSSRGLAHNRVAFELLPGSSIADSDAAAAAGNLDFIRYFHAKGFDCSYKGAALAAVGGHERVVEKLNEWGILGAKQRSEERRVGKECVGECRSR